MAHRWTNDLTHADVTPKEVFMNRRQILAGTAGLGAIAAAGMVEAAEGLEPNSLQDITSYNNYYEFGTGKGDPAKNAHQLDTTDWKVTVDGMVDNPGEYDLADLLDGLTEEERIYRFRCVEAWAMVVPWNGIELADILNKVGMHPLTIMATGIYGEPISKQNGAPMRLVVPWKYGFKSIKSIVRITLTDEQPPMSWNIANPREYGFYSNVNPEVDHPRWSQASHRKIGGGLFNAREDTLMFNGYPEVAGLYEGMDLRENF